MVCIQQFISLDFTERSSEVCLIQGRIQDFLMGGGGGGGVAYTKRPPNKVLINFKLSYVCPRKWRFRKDNLETLTLQNVLLTLVGQKKTPSFV